MPRTSSRTAGELCETSTSVAGSVASRMTETSAGKLSPLRGPPDRVRSSASTTAAHGAHLPEPIRALAGSYGSLPKASTLPEKLPSRPATAAETFPETAQTHGSTAGGSKTAADARAAHTSCTPASRAPAAQCSRGHSHG